MDHHEKTDGHVSGAQNAKDGKSDLQKGCDRDVVKDEPLKEERKRKRSITGGKLKGRERDIEKDLPLKEKGKLKRSVTGSKLEGRDRDIVEGQPSKEKGKRKRSVTGSKLKGRESDIVKDEPLKEKGKRKKSVTGSKLKGRDRDIVEDQPLKEKGKRKRSDTDSKLEDHDRDVVKDQPLKEKGKRKRSVTRSKLKGRDRDVVKDQPLKEKGKRKRSIVSSKLKAGSKQPRLSRKDKGKVKSLHKVDLYDRESCNPSYKPIPENEPIPEASQRTLMDELVLNDDWVSVTCRSHRNRNSLKEPPRSKHEEVLYKLEDSRMEIEVLLESINVTIKRAEKLNNMIDNKSIETDGLFPLEDYFPGPSLWCIKTLYGNEYGVVVVKKLRENISFVLQVVLVRLNQKQEELRNWCSKFKELL